MEAVAAQIVVEETAGNIESQTRNSRSYNFYCDVCDQTLSSYEQLQKHKLSGLHLKNCNKCSKDARAYNKELENTTKRKRKKNSKYFDIKQADSIKGN